MVSLVLGPSTKAAVREVPGLCERDSFANLEVSARGARTSWDFGDGGAGEPFLHASYALLGETGEGRRSFAEARSSSPQHSSPAGQKLRAYPSLALSPCWAKTVSVSTLPLALHLHC